MRKPVIGITLNWYANDQSKVQSYGKWLFGLNQSYAEFLGKADVITMGIIPSSEDFRSMLEVVDMVVLTGGGDTDPELYGQRDNGSIQHWRDRPLWEIGLYRKAREMKVPVLGICLGIQTIAIAEGEQLIQDISTQMENPEEHHGEAADPRMHTVEIIEGTILSGILDREIAVSSFHHQAIAGIPEGFYQSAKSHDGVIEGMESDDGLVVAVQWHPERDFTGPLILKSLIPRFCGDTE
ncbi:MAG: gamma-glutamyl-gamma-aminobutyrate hydrolase family protein [Candidatus Aegiribacteria sp.]|nr:gamma-glutamyl-gamma-aminobutyrate hydrolase family protein [Candidatus Aegiribacteria sp.]